MKLVGMLDSPFVRRTFISGRMLGIPFEHQALSVLRHVDEFRAINPLLKAPTLVCDDGEVLVDSSQIITLFESLAAPGTSLLPADPDARRRCLQLTGFGLAAAEKALHRYLETRVRPKETRFPAWLERTERQLSDTWAMIDARVGDADWLCGDAPTQADITVAVAWRFTHHSSPGLIADGDFPHVAALAANAETLPAFVAADFT